MRSLFFIYQRKSLLLRRIFSILWTILILIGCSLPGKDIPKVNIFEHFDKVVHFVFFFIYFMLWFFTINKSFKNSIILLLISIIYGFSIELYQMNFVKGRSFDVWDGVADGIGALAALIFLHNIIKPEAKNNISALP